VRPVGVACLAIVITLAYVEAGIADVETVVPEDIEMVAKDSILDPIEGDDSGVRLKGVGAGFHKYESPMRPVEGWNTYKNHRIFDGEHIKAKRDNKESHLTKMGSILAHPNKIDAMNDADHIITLPKGYVEKEEERDMEKQDEKHKTCDCCGKKVAPHPQHGCPQCKCASKSTPLPVLKPVKQPNQADRVPSTISQACKHEPAGVKRILCIHKKLAKAKAPERAERHAGVAKVDQMTKDALKTAREARDAKRTEVYEGIPDSEGAEKDDLAVRLQEN